MKTDPNLRLRKVGRHHMIVKVDETRVNMTDVFTLNDTAAWLWQKAGDAEFTEDMLAGWLCGEYGIGMDEALADARETVRTWREYGLLSDSAAEGCKSEAERCDGI